MLTPSATYSTCSTSTRGSWQIIPRMGRKKVDRWRHRAELVNQGVTRFLMFLSCVSWMTARCTMLSSRGLPSNREIAHVCAGYASSFPAWKRTYHDLPWLTDCSLQGGARLKRQNQYFEVVGSSSSVPLGRNGWIAHALKPIAARGLAHWRRSRCIDLFLGHQMIHESESVKSSPGPIWYLNQSTWLCRAQVGQIASLAKKSISYKLRSYPSATLWNPKLKAGVTEVHLSVENKQPFMSLSDS